MERNYEQYAQGRGAYLTGIPFDEKMPADWQEGWLDAADDDAGSWMY